MNPPLYLVFIFTGRTMLECGEAQNEAELAERLSKTRPHICPPVDLVVYKLDTVYHEDRIRATS